MEQAHGVLAIVFDLDGTLFHLNVDWGFVKEQCHREYLDALGITFSQASGMAADPRLAKMFDFIGRIELEGVATGALAAGAKTVVPALGARYQTAIVTRNCRESAQRVAKMLELEGAALVGRQDVLRCKPDPEGIFLALERIKIPASCALMVGDTFHDVQAAHRAGMPCVIVKNDRLAFNPQGADAYIEDLSGLQDAIESLRTL